MRYPLAPSAVNLSAAGVILRAEGWFGQESGLSVAWAQNFARGGKNRGFLYPLRDRVPNVGVMGRFEMEAAIA